LNSILRASSYRMNDMNEHDYTSTDNMLEDQLYLNDQEYNVDKHMKAVALAAASIYILHHGYEEKTDRCRKAMERQFGMTFHLMCKHDPLCNIGESIRKATQVESTRLWRVKHKISIRNLGIHHFKDFKKAAGTDDNVPMAMEEPGSDSDSDDSISEQEEGEEEEEDAEQTQEYQTPPAKRQRGATTPRSERRR
jgi:hypothetical protein